MAVAGTAVNAGGPGVPSLFFSRFHPSLGAWSRYSMVEESMGVADTTDLYLSLPARETRGGILYYRVEMLKRPRGRPGAPLAAYLLVRAGEDYRHAPPSSYVKEMVVREADGSVSKVDLRELEDGSGSPEMRWEETGVESLRVGRRVIPCRVERGSGHSRKVVPVGSATLVEESQAEGRIWWSEDIPLFGTVRCTLELRTRSHLDPPLPGVPVSKPKVYRITVELLDFGSEGARAPFSGEH